jgi:hypothetical protein
VDKELSHINGHAKTHIHAYRNTNRTGNYVDTVIEKLSVFDQAPSAGQVPSQYTHDSFENICISGEHFMLLLLNLTV